MVLRNGHEMNDHAESMKNLYQKGVLVYIDISLSPMWQERRVLENNIKNESEVTGQRI